MRRITVVAILVMGLVSLGMAFAFQNEPEGFRGLEWGDPPPGEDMEDWIKTSSNDNELWYERKDDKLKIGGAKLTSIGYQFYKGQFMAVWISTEVSNHKALEDVVKLNFGPGYSQDYSSGGDRRKTEQLFGTAWQRWLYQWSGDIATVTLKIRSEYRSFRWLSCGHLTIHSTKIYNQYQEDERRQEEEEARRKEEERRNAAEEGLADFDYIPETKEEKKESNTKEKLKTEKSGKVIFNGEEVSDEEKIKPEEEGRGRGIRGLLGEAARKIEKQVEPPYPEWAQREGKTGVVRVKCWVLPSGDVRNVEVYQSSGLPRLDEHVCQYLMMWKFEPIEGQEVQWGIVPFHFEFPEK